MPKQILLSLCGKTPQILTETLYCMMIQRNISVSEVWLVTTQSGKTAAVAALLHPQHGKFYAFCREYGIDPNSINFSAENIIAPHDMADILQVEDNESFADLLSQKVRILTQDDDSLLYCSIAGGRKTMSAYLAMIMQFFARPQDRLIHVIVGTPAFENHPDFYYPPITPRFIDDGHGGRISTAEAGLVLVDIPFIRILEKIPEFREQPLTFSQMVSVAQHWIQSPREQPHLIVDSRSHSLYLGNRPPIRLTHARFSIYRWFAEFSSLRPDTVDRRDYAAYFVRGGFQLSDTCRKHLIALYPRFAEIDGLDLWPRLQQEISKINKQLRERLNDLPCRDEYLISVHGGYGEKYYGIMLDKRRMTIL